MAHLSGPCPNCRERRVSQVQDLYQTEVIHDGRPYSLSVPDLIMLKCEACGNRVLPPESDNRVSDAIREAAGLLSPSEIVSRRSALGLTPSEMANLLHIPEAVYSKWESGRLIQQRHSDLLLRSLFAVPELRSYLGTQSASPYSQVA